MNKQTVLRMVQDDLANFHRESLMISETIEDLKQDTINYINSLISQIKVTSAGSLMIAKTPKNPRTRGTRIDANQENDKMNINENLSNASSSRFSRMDSMILETSDIQHGRLKRVASVKAAVVIRNQQSVTLNSKHQRTFEEDSDILLANRIVKGNRSKRPKIILESSEDEDLSPLKHSKVEEKKLQSNNVVNDETYDATDNSINLSDENEILNLGRKKRATVKRKLDEETDSSNTTFLSEGLMRRNSLYDDEPVAKISNYLKSSLEKSERDSKYLKIVVERISIPTESSKRSVECNTRSSINAQRLETHKINNNKEMVNESIASMYEDAIGKPVPIMKSTINVNTRVRLEKMMNVSVLIERLSTKNVLNETVTIKKHSFEEASSRENSTTKEMKKKINAKNEKIDEFNALITEDESSPERKLEYKAKKEKLLNQQERITRSNISLTSDEDEILGTPTKINQRNNVFKESVMKSVHKEAILLSPYTKDFVKRRVEALEQASTSPKQNRDEIPGRITRTKTRALAAASSSKATAAIVVQKLGGKSLVEAKKISLTKQAKGQNENTNIKSKKISSVERSAQKRNAKATPIGKNQMVWMPVSKNSFATPSNSSTLQCLNSDSKSQKSHGNIASHVNSFVQPNKSASKRQLDRAAEEKRCVHDQHEEDAQHKREELLKAQTEEKRRKREEKELKNKLAREAKEKLEYEKRLEAEREKEKKAMLVQQMQELHKEQMERKRKAQLQRAQEKEDRRKQEEQLQLQRVQEQEQERQLTKQKLHEQKMDKQKQAEMRQQIVELKMKNHMNKALLQTEAKGLAQKQVPSNYKIDSDPDEDASDNESKPKYQIPPWASKHVRETQLKIQQYVPMKSVLAFFNVTKSTPDLRELFQGIDPRKLKRSSSAIWKTNSPRCSMIDSILL